MIIETNADLSLTGHPATTLSELLSQINICIHENAFQNVVCRMSAILSLINFNHETQRCKLKLNLPMRKLYLDLY